MQTSMVAALDAAATEPLLPSLASGAPPAAAAAGGGRAEAAASGQEAASSLRFTRRFAVLLRLLRPYPALFLALLAVGEAVVVAEGGQPLCSLSLSRCRESWARHANACMPARG